MTRSFSIALVLALSLACGVFAEPPDSETKAKATTDERTERIAECERLVAEARQAADAQKEDEALKLAQQALTLEKRLYGADSTDRLETLDFALGCAENLYDWPHAEAFCDEMTRIARLAYGGEHYRTTDAILERRRIDELKRLSLQVRASLKQSTLDDTRSTKLYNDGKTAEAIELAEQTLQLRKKLVGEDDLMTAWSAGTLAGFYKREGKFVEAEQLANGAVATIEKQFGPNNPATAMQLRLLGEILVELRRYPQAEQSFRRALGILDNTWGPDNFSTGICVDRLASLCETRRDYAEAAKLLQRRLATAEKTSGLDAKETRRAVNDLARVYHSSGNYLEAETLLLRSLKLDVSVDGEEHPSTATRLYNLASLYRDMGKYEQCESLELKALKIREITLGPDSVDTANCLNDLGLLYQMQARLTEAEPLLKRALAIYEKAVGPDGFSVSVALNNLASVYQDQTNYAAAEPLLIRALRISEQSLGAAAPDVAIKLNNLGAQYLAQGNFVAAEPCLQRALLIRETGLGPEHPLTAASIDFLSEFHRKSGNYAAAEPLARRALAIRQKTRGPAHVETAVSMTTLALLLVAKQDYAEAEPLFQQALQAREQAFGPDHPTTAKSVSNLGFLYKHQGNARAARPLFERALAIFEKTLGPDHADSSISRIVLASFLLSQKEFPAAITNFERALAINEQVRGPDHPTTIHVVGQLALAHWLSGDLQAAKAGWSRSLDSQLRQLIQTAAVQTEQQQLATTAEASSHLYNWLTVTAADAKSTNEAWRRVLLWKGLTTARQISLRQSLKDDPTYSELRTASQQLSTMTLRPPQPPDNPKLVADWSKRAPQLRGQWQKQRSLLEAECDRLEKELAKKSAAFDQNHQRQAVTPESIVESLRQTSRSTALVDLIAYLYIDAEQPSQKRIAAFIARSDGGVQRVELGPAAPIDLALVDWRASFGKATAGRDPGAALRKLLWTPLEPALQGVETVLISPDRELAQLPWAALPGGKRGTFLIEERAIAVIPVPQLLPELLRREVLAGPPASLLLAGDIDYQNNSGASAELLAQSSAQGRLREGKLRGFSQLPGGKIELSAIDQQYRHDNVSGVAKILNQRIATESAFRELAPRHAWLHLITHGYFAPAEVTKNLNIESTRGADIDQTTSTVEVGPPPGRIGLNFSFIDNICRVTEIVPGSATERDGRVQVGDELAALAASTGDWIPTKGNLPVQIQSHIRGPAGTSARLRVRPKDKPDTLVEYAIERVALPGASAPRAVINPGLLSGLAFAGANLDPMPGQDDGVLTALEVSALDLSKVDTVVLSACETGLGEVAGGEGLLGLQRSFQVAGAKSVVASLWKVNDRATQLLMSDFYENLWNKKLGKLESLRQAQIKLLRLGNAINDVKTSRGLTLDEAQPPLDSDRLPPFYWAAFVLSGDWR